MSKIKNLIGAGFVAVFVPFVTFAQAKQAGERHAEQASAFQINSAHSGSVNFESGFSAPLKQIWKKTFKGFTSYAVIARGRAFVVALDNDTQKIELYALSLADGKVLWSRHLGGILWGAPAIDGDRVFVVSRGGEVAALDQATGTQLWIKKLHTDFNSAPTVYRKRLYIKGHDATLGTGDVYAIDEADGNIAWTASGFPASQDTMAIGKGDLFTCDGYRLSVEDGSVKWQTPTDCSDPGRAAVYFGDRVYIRSDDARNNLILDAGSGSAIGTFGGASPPAFSLDSAGRKFGVMVAGAVAYGFSAKSGAVIWSFSGDGQISTPAIVVNGIVVVGSWLGNLYLISGLDGAVLWSTNVGSAITPSEEGFEQTPLTGLSAGEGVLLVPASGTLTAYAPQSPKN